MTRRQICVVCPGSGLPDADELSVAARRLAAVLAAGGAAVTLLQARGAAPPEIALNGVQAVALPPLEVPLAPCAPVTALSWRCRAWLAEQRFDLVLFPDRGGLAYYPLLARRQRLALADTAIAVFACGPSLWLCDADGRLEDSFDLVATDYQERRSVEMADAMVVPPQAGLLEWMRGAGWRLTAPIIEQALPSPVAARPAATPVAIEELVYVGSLSRRDGLLLFCAAVERIAPLLAERGIAVRLLGPVVPHDDFDAVAHLAGRSARWPFPHALEAVPLTGEVLADRLAPGRLAVLPAPAPGLALALEDCRALGVPVLTGGELRPPELAECLAAALDTSPPPAAPPPPADWAALAERLCGLAPLPPPVQPSALPLVSVCLSHFNRPQLLERAVASVLAQTYQPLEIIVVDDGSDAPARARLDALERGWGERVRVIRQSNRYLGAARNAAARAARGEFLLFMDDDNLALPEEVATMVRIAQETGAEVLTTVINLFTDDDALAAGAPPTALWVPLGGCAAGGLYSNVFGDANALIRRSAFEAVGGFTEAYGLGLEDWELFARLALSGVRFDVVATPLLWYRQNPGGMLLASINRPAELRRAASGYLAAVPEFLAPALLLAQGVAFRSDLYRREYRAAAALLEERLRAMGEMDEMIRERDRVIAAQTAMIDERDQVVAAQKAMVEERWTAMQEMGREISSRQQIIDDLKAEVAERDAVIQAQEERYERLRCTRLAKALRRLLPWRSGAR